MEDNVRLLEQIEDMEETITDVISIIRDARIAWETTEGTDILRSVRAVEKLLQYVMTHDIGSLKDMLNPGSSR